MKDQLKIALSQLPCRSTRDFRLAGRPPVAAHRVSLENRSRSDLRSMVCITNTVVRNRTRSVSSLPIVPTFKDKSLLFLLADQYGKSVFSITYASQ